MKIFSGDRSSNIFQWSETGVCKYDSWVKSGVLPVFINKVLLEQGRVYSFACCLGYFCHKDRAEWF
jgi:hypothetical protein